MRGYLRFLLTNARFLAFGLLVTLTASFGQTYFIALFSGQIRATFALSHGGFGLVYSLATLASGLSLIWLGRQIDRVELPTFTGVVLAGLSAAALLMVWAQGVLLLAVALFGLRLAGQGLLGHIAITSMARYFEPGRGKALGFATLGHALGEAVFPMLAVTLIGVLGWRLSWLGIALSVPLLFAPALLWLLRGHGERHAGWLGRVAAQDAAERDAPGDRHWSQADVLRDRHFWLLMPAVLAPSFIITGLFFHQVHLVAAKGWTLAWFALGFTVYASAALLASLLAGPLIDRWDARRLMPVYLLPMAAALAVLALFSDPVMAMLFMLLFGVSAGASQTVTAAMWAEVYGTRHLGAIRALVGAFSVLSSALSPAALGVLIDRGVSMEAIALLCLAEIILGIGLLALVFPDEVRGLLPGGRRPVRS